MAYLLPATIYQSPPRPVRGRQLNTILEDHEESSYGAKSGSDSEGSENTIIGRPASWNPKFFIAAPRRSRLSNAITLESPVSDASSPCSTEGLSRRSTGSSLYGSDAETVFSDSCPSLGESVDSVPTSFATNSNRSSVASSKSGRNRYPSILIPHPSMWPSLASPAKNSPVPITSASKISVSPAALLRLSRWVPAINVPPSLGDDSSIASESPSVSDLSAPVTPDLRNVHPSDAGGWGVQQQVILREEPDTARDNDSVHLSSQETSIIERHSQDWSDIVINFPDIPGSTPQSNTPCTPGIEGLRFFHEAETTSEYGVELPADAMRTLEHLVGERSPVLSSTASTCSKHTKEEMKEMPLQLSRPRSFDGATPMSDASGYSFSQMSIPSPGGFFSSLRAGTRHTWAPNQSKLSNPPSSTTAENFYNVPWMAEQRRSIERVFEADEPNTDDPPTARQAVFDAGVKDHPGPSDNGTDSEDDDLYGPGNLTAHRDQSTQELRYEYEEAYEDEIKQAAVANIDRTSGWLAAQSSYLSALRETNPVNDVTKTPVNALPTSKDEKEDVTDSPLRRAVHFLEQAVIAVDAAESPRLSPTPKEVIFHSAFQHLHTSRRRSNAYKFAATRLEAVDSLRVAHPDLHTDQLLGRYELRSPDRPEYSGPFSQNPRQTGNFTLTSIQNEFGTVYREEEALAQTGPAIWILDAFRYVNGGSLLFAPGAQKRLARATLPLSHPESCGRNRVRVLDLGGVTACNWSWAVAMSNPNVKCYSVVDKTQTINADIAGPKNHRQVSVPRLWQLPFRDSFFDVISARSLHALLRAEPVPGIDRIDEYELCLKECLRVLKPGGYLEFMVMDSGLVSGGPLCDKLSVEFGFQLKRSGYDPDATRAWLGRLRRTGFTECKRAWMWLPMGRARQEENAGLAEADQWRDVTGILGQWMWESWMAKMGVKLSPAVVEEGRKMGAGWKVLSGWARKPVLSSV